MASEQADSGPATFGSNRPLWATFDVRVGDECPLTDIAEPISRVTCQQIGETCECDVVTEDSPVQVLHRKRKRGENCLADIFHRFDCVPQISAVEDDSLSITVHPPNRQTIPALLEAIRDGGYAADIRRLVGVEDCDSDAPSTALVDRSALTEKQREAMDAALENGYYDDAKGTTLKQLAEEEVHISQSALSRRLRAAECKLLREAWPRP